MKIGLSTTRFTEYNIARKGQYFIKIEQKTEKDGWMAIGYIDRVYDSEKKKFVYYAKDPMGNKIFVDYKDLFILKNKFKENGKTLAMVAKTARQVNMAQGKGISNPKGEQRFNDIKNVREKKYDKGKEREKNNPEEKDRESTQKEKVEKEEQDKPEIVSKYMDEFEQSDTEERIQENPADIEESEREMELNEIRDRGEDKDQDIEMEMDR